MTIIRPTALILAALTALPAAALTVSGTPSGVSAYDAGTSGTSTTTTGTPTLFGGLAGTATGLSTSTINNCTATLTACNERRITGSTVVTIPLTPAGSGNAVLTAGDTTTRLDLVSATNGGTSVATTWDEICAKALGTQSAACESLDATKQYFTGTVRIWIDNNADGTLTEGTDEYKDVNVVIIKPNPTTSDVFVPNTTYGVNTFTPYPGDEKIYYEDQGGESSFPSLGESMKAKKIKIYFSDNTLLEAKPGSATGDAELTLDDTTGTPVDNVVSGLNNGTTYVFRIAIMDQANNITLFYPNEAGTAPNFPACETAPVPPRTDPGGCPVATIPDEVLGMLTDDLNCFVATAAYGSSLEPKLKTFREFRQKVLLPTGWGRKFVFWYYKYGPYGARYIAHHPVVQSGARLALWPVYGFARLALRFGFLKSLLATSALLALFAALPLIRRRGAAARA